MGKQLTILMSEGLIGAAKNFNANSLASNFLLAMLGSSFSNLQNELDIIQKIK
jgi:hypothetical protein